MKKIAGAVVLVALLVGGSAQGASKAAPVNTSPPTISGTERAGETLNASSGSWSNSPTSFSYRWQRCDKNGNNCNNLGGATNQTYTLVKGDSGHRIRVSVTAKNSDGSANAVSSPTGIIADGLQPENTAIPVISGTAKAGNTLSTSNGSWKNNPTSYEYQWRRCDTSGNNCHGVGPNKSAYALDSGDVGSTIRVTVRAGNAFGSNPATSAQTAVVAAAGPAPANTALPVIGGVPRDGQILVTNTGNWANSPNHYDYQWLRCDAAGNNCGNFGANSSTQRLAPSEVGHTIRVAVSARNAFGTTRAVSAQTAVVGSSAGPTSIPVDQVSLPNQLVFSAVQFIPKRLNSRAAFIGRFRVSDTRGNLVRGALVYAIGLPYGWVRAAPEVVSGSDGWATIQFFPTRLMPVHRAALVFFVRGRKPGEKLLTGVSTRRLVQISIG